MSVNYSIAEEFENMEILANAAQPKREQLLNDAVNLTCGDRNRTYGEPVGNMQHIANIFNAWTGRDLSAREVAQLHICTKMARRHTSPDHRDSYVDDMAYTGIEYECATSNE